MKTFVAKNSEIQRNWHLIDASEHVLGRLASRIAMILRGKDKPEYTPHVDTGDFVVVVNAEKINFTGNKLHDKTYYWHTGYPGGIKSRTLEKMLDEKPEVVLEKAVKGMMPRNKLSRTMLKKLKIYAGEAHPHAAQSPKILKELK